MMNSGTVTDDNWRTQNFRQNMVSKIDEAILQCGSPTTKNAIEMEGQVFAKAKSKDEYLQFVARLILHIKEMKSKAPGGVHNPTQGNPGQMGGQMMGGNQNLQMMNQLNTMSAPVGMGGVNSMMNQQGNYGSNVPQNQIQGGQPQPQTQINAQQQLQMQQQQPNTQQQQMMNQNVFMQQQQQQMQNAQLHNQQGPNQLQSPQLQGHHMQGMMSSNPQQQMMVGRGMQSQQLMGNRMMSPQPNMANQLTRMAQQRNADGGLLPNYNTGPAGTVMQRGMNPNQFMSPNQGQGLSMGASPSPGGMGVSSGPAPPYGSSPGSAGMIHSPAGSVLRPYMVPSPGSSLNTPMMVAPTPSPRNAEDQACMEKIKELRKYTDLLQKMLAKVGNDDVEKSSKMKKLLDILTNPRSSVSMDLLIKCEAALKKMERTDAGGPASVPQQTPGKDQMSPFTQFFESVQTMHKFPSAGHTWKRTVQPAMDAFFGHATLFESDKAEDSEESEVDDDVLWTLKKELKLLSFLKFKVKFGTETGKLICTLADRRLPTIPPLKICFTSNYPDQSPRIVGMTKDYGSTPLLRSISQGLKSRMLNCSEKFTVTEILVNWEMSVRQVTSGKQKTMFANTKKVDKEKVVQKFTTPKPV